jgi:hypothetical protein
MNTLLFKCGSALLLTILIPHFLFSQTIEEEIGETENLHVAKAHILEHLDLTQLSPPILWDFGIVWLDLKPYDGN